jgi:UPF0176 protein
MQLYNKLSAQERADLLEAAGTERLTLSFYQYAHIGNPQLFRDHLFLSWEPIEVLGRIYVAQEGINAQLSLPASYFKEFKEHLDSISFLKHVRLNIAIEQDLKSFLKLTIKVRDKIVADGLENNEFDATQKGIHVNAIKFNKLLEDKNTICVDMRNHYESEIGHFQNAITPDVDTFRESLPIIERDLSNYKENKNLLMYCTGGIRCEKASAYFKHKGFKKVFQLEGGIIEYARQVKKNELENKFIGKNFVFDERRAERISEDIIAQCHQCGKPCDTHINCINEACHLLFLQCKLCGEKMNQSCSNACKEITLLSDEEQKVYRKGNHNSNKVFKKGRSESLKFK